MPKVRDVLSHLCVVTTKERRKCARNEEHRILPGGQCLIIKAGPNNPTLSYCLKCGQEILLTATNRLRDIEASFDRCGDAAFARRGGGRSWCGVPNLACQFAQG
jgi:hypothetical protein